MNIELTTELSDALYRRHGFNVDVAVWSSSVLADSNYVNGISPGVRKKTAIGMTVNEAVFYYIHQDHALSHWAKYGFNTFHLTHSLTAALLLTASVGSSSECTYMPFGSFIIAIPDEFISIGQVHGSVKWCRYLLVSRYIQDGMDCLSTWVHTNGKDGGDIHFGMQVPLGEYLDETTAGRCLEVRGDAKAHTKENLTAVALSKRIVVNFLSWMHANQGIKNRTPNTYPKNKHGRDSRVRPVNWIIGREVRISTDIIEAAKDGGYASGGRPREGWMVKSRYIVRGHMRNQACGTRMSLRKTIWVEPYWKGPEGAAAWSHIYKDRPLDDDGQ